MTQDETAGTPSPSGSITPDLEPGPGRPASAAAGPVGPRLEAGDLLCERFRLFGRLGRGGMGEVFEALDEATGTRVALKVIRGDAVTPKAFEDMSHELLLARRVTHRNVCRVFELFVHRTGTGEELPCLAMELLRGGTLLSRTQRGPLEAGRAAALARGIARALAAAHAAGVVHRDLKSANVVVVDASGDDPERPVLTDFGIAHAIGGRGPALGTRPYVAPEVLAGRAASPAADVYSLGVILVEMMLGRPVAERLGSPPALSRRLRASGAPRRLVRVVEGCLAEEPRDRYPDGSAVVRALEGPAARPSRPLREAAGWLAAASLGIAVAWTLAIEPGGKEPRRSPEAARRHAARPVVAFLGFEAAGTAGDRELAAAVAEFVHWRLGARDDIVVRRLEGAVPLAGPSDRAAALARPVEAARLLGARAALVGGLVRHPDRTVGLELRLHAVDSRDRIVARGQASEERLFALAYELAEELGRRLVGPTPRGEEGGSAALLSAEPRANRLFGRGLLAGERGRHGEAQRWFAEAVRLDPGFALALAHSAQVQLQRGDLPAARSAAAGAMEGADRIPRRYQLFLQALMDESAERWEGAARRYAALWTFYPEDSALGLRLASSQLAFDPDAAAETLRQVERAGPRGATAIELAIGRARLAGARGHATDRRGHARRALALAGERGVPHVLAGAAHLELGLALGDGGALREALVHLAAAERRFVAGGDAGLRIEALGRQGSVLGDLGDVSEAERRLRHALDLSSAGGSLRTRCSVLSNLGTLLLTSGRFADAEDLLREGAALARRIEFARAEGIALNNVAIIEMERGRNAAAAAAYERSLVLARRLDASDMVASTSLNLAELYRVLGQRERAERAARESAQISREHGLGFGVVAGHMSSATIALAGLDAHLALREIREARRLAGRVGMPYLTAQVELLAGMIHDARGEAAAARASLEEARRDLEGLGDVLSGAAATLAMAEVELGERRCAEAAREARAARDRYAQGRRAPGAARAAQVMAEAALCAGDHDSARRALAESRGLRGSSDHAALLLREELLECRLEATACEGVGRGPLDIARRARGAGFADTYFEAALVAAQRSVSRDPASAGARLRRLAAQADASGFGRYAVAARLAAAGLSTELPATGAAASAAADVGGGGGAPDRRNSE